MSSLYSKLENLYDQDFINGGNGNSILEWLIRHREEIENIEIDYLNDISTSQDKITDLEAKLAESEKAVVSILENADRQNKSICETDIYPLQEENQQLKEKLEIKLEELHIAYCGIESVKTKNGNLKAEIKELKQQLAKERKKVVQEIRDKALLKQMNIDNDYDYEMGVNDDWVICIEDLTEILDQIEQGATKKEKNDEERR